MRILFCSDTFSPGQPDEAFQPEAQAAVEAGFDFSLINFERLKDVQNPEAALRRIKPVDEGGLALYRGWMLRPGLYEIFYEALRERNLTLINTPEQYRHCHYLPESLSVIAAQTPRTVYLPTNGNVDMAKIHALLEPFGDSPLILKDYVKSRKHDWETACFIPSAGNRAAVERVVQRFVDLQGEQLEGGLVFREFVPLRKIGTHSKSGMPLTREFRIFFLDGKLLFSSEYWDEGAYGEEPPPVEEFLGVAAKVKSRFFTMDIAQREDGSWLIIELGDGQVAGLPHPTDAARLYAAFSQIKEF